MSTSRRSRRPIIGLSLAMTLLFAACSSSSSGSSSDEETVSSASTEGASSADATSEAASSDYLGSYALADDEFGTMVTVSVEGATRTIDANAIPDHETGEFPNAGNPNTITEQSASYSYTTEPVFAGDETGAHITGVAVNGVKFEPGTAETVTCESGETLRVEALQDVYNLGLDFNNAHVQPTGEYHYHGVSELLVDAYSTSDDLVHVGFAADGYLMYYSKSGAYDSSYVLSDKFRVGTDCVASGPAGGSTVAIEGSTPDGTYTSDYLFDASAGDLDACNGVTVDGEYVYIITNSYPFVGRCLNGAVSGVATQGPPDGSAQENGAATSGQQPDLAAAASALGVSKAELQAALGGPPPDFDAAAATLGISIEELMAVVPAPPGQG